MGYLIFISATRTALVSVLLGFLILMFVYFRTYGGNQSVKNVMTKNKLILAVIFFLIGIVFSSIYLTKHYKIEAFARYALILEDFIHPGTHHSLSTRIVEWKFNLQHYFFRDPLFGSGIGSTISPRTLYENVPFPDLAKVTKTVLAGSSNIAIWLLMKTGIIGFLLFLNIFIIFFSSLFHAIRKTEDPFGYSALLGIFASSIAILLDSFVFNSNITTYTFNILFSLFFAITAYYNRKVYNQRNSTDAEIAVQSGSENIGK